MKAKITKTGYRSNSPDVGNPVNVIPSNIISMVGVEFPVIGIDNLNNYQIMYPGNEYKFDGDYVIEFPIRNQSNYKAMNGKSGWANQDGNGSTCTTASPWGAVGASAGSLISGAFGVLETSMTNKTNKEIAQSTLQNQQLIAAAGNASNESIQAGKNTTALLLAEDKANAPVAPTTLSGPSLGGLNVTVPDSSGTMILIGLILAGATAGVIWYLTKKQKVQ